METRCLLVCGGRGARLEPVVEELHRHLWRAGLSVDRVNASDLTQPRLRQEHAAVIVGGVVERGRLSPSVVRFVLTHRERLRGVPLAYFAVGPRRLGEEARRLREAAWLGPLRDLLPPLEAGVCDDGPGCVDAPFIRRFLLRLTAACRSEARSCPLAATCGQRSTSCASLSVQVTSPERSRGQVAFAARFA